MLGTSLREYYSRRKGKGRYKFKYLPGDEVVFRENGIVLLAEIDALTNLDGRILYNLKIVHDGTYRIDIPEDRILKFDEKILIPVQFPLRI